MTGRYRPRVNLNKGGAVIALAIDHDQDLVGPQAAQRGRTHEGGGVGNGVLRDIEGRDDVSDDVQEVEGGLVGELRAANDVDRRG